MYTVAIIGAGQLGSRHLQGLLTINIPIKVEVLDSNPASLSLAETRANEIPLNDNILGITYCNDLTDLSNEIDLVIIATTSSVRYLIIEQLLQSKTVKNMILEKVLFQKIPEYDMTQALLLKNNVKCWVNCPRRSMPVYQKLRSLIAPGEVLTCTVIGGSWGLASNAIHFIDLINYLNGADEFTYTTSSIAKVENAKRPGYLELSGTLYAHQSNGSDILFHSRGNSTAELRIQLLSENYFWEIDEIRQTITTSAGNNKWERNSSGFQILYQSQLTGIISEEILRTGKTELTDYTVSSKLHKDFLDAVSGLFNSDSSYINTICPIT